MVCVYLDLVVVFACCLRFGDFEFCCSGCMVGWFCLRMLLGGWLDWCFIIWFGLFVCDLLFVSFTVLVGL